MLVCLRGSRLEPSTELISFVLKTSLDPPQRFLKKERMDGSCWGLHAKDTFSKGSGVFAGTIIPCGSKIFRFAGPVYRTAECPNFDESIQVGEDAWMWSSGGLDDLINHSCTPNAGLSTQPDGLWVVAIQDISMDEEVTYDYSTAMLNDPCNPPMACACCTPACRGIIVNFLDLQPALQHKYLALGILPDFIREAASASLGAKSPRGRVFEANSSATL